MIWLGLAVLLDLVEWPGIVDLLDLVEWPGIAVLSDWPFRAVSPLFDSLLFVMNSIIAQ